MKYYVCSPDVSLDLFKDKRYITGLYPGGWKWIVRNFGRSAILVEDLDEELILLLTLRCVVFTEVTHDMLYNSTCSIGDMFDRWYTYV